MHNHDEGNREEAAGFLQTWLLFRTTGEIFGVSITPSAFVWVDDHGRSRIPTARLPIYVREREERISSGSVQIDQEPCRKAITVSRTLADDAKIVGTESSIPTLIGSEIHLPSPIRTSGLGKHPRRNPPRHDKVIEMIVVSDHGGRQDKTIFPSPLTRSRMLEDRTHVPSLQEGSEDRPRVSGKCFFFSFSFQRGACLPYARAYQPVTMPDRQMLFDTEQNSGPLPPSGNETKRNGRLDSHAPRYRFPCPTQRGSGQVRSGPLDRNPHSSAASP